MTRAREAGLTAALVILSAGDEAEAARARKVREAWPAVRFAAGVHPHSAGAFAGRPGDPAAKTAAFAGPPGDAGATAAAHATASDAAAKTATHVTAFAACAVGEIGLDYHYDFAARDVQRDVFAAQLALAQQLGRPVIIHTREATDDTFDVLAQAGALRGVFHCFTGDAAMARRALDIGFFLSFSGILTFPKAESIRDAARLVPDDRLLVETDSPYLAPVPFRGQRNEPARVSRVVDALAALRGGTPSAMAERTSLNFTGLFGPC